MWFLRCVPVWIGEGDWYWGTMRDRYHRADCGGEGFGRRLAIHPREGRTTPNPRIPEPALMIKDVVARSWRFAVTVAPIVAIALTLAAGLKWR